MIIAQGPHNDIMPFGTLQPFRSQPHVMHMHDTDRQNMTMTSTRKAGG